MQTFPWIIIAILIFIIFLVIVYLLFKRGRPSPPDYYAFFIMGITWFVTGIPLSFFYKNYGLLAMGLIFTIVGLINKKKWKENHRTWKDLVPEEKKIKTILMVILGIFVLAGLIFYFLYR